MNKTVLCAVLAMSLLTQGCCSIFTSGPQTVSVDSDPPGAKVAIGPYTGTTPYNVSLPRGKTYVVQATVNGKTKKLNLEKKIEPIYWVNILFFPGLIVDLATGKMWRYDQTQYNFDFRPSTASVTQ
ncbi:MAG: PEGA domain-containing protein [Planctomycetota bacterium]